MFCGQTDASANDGPLGVQLATQPLMLCNQENGRKKVKKLYLMLPPFGFFFPCLRLNCILTHLRLNGEWQKNLFFFFFQSTALSVKMLK